VINLERLFHRKPRTKEKVDVECAEEPELTVSHVPFEVAYQVLFGPQPEPEDVRKEQYLLDCD